MKYLYDHDYMADPSAHVFNDKIYIYPSHDRDTEHSENDNGDHFDMRDYHVLRMDSIHDQQAVDCGKVLDIADIPWASRQLWDNDVMEYGGKYYMIFCAKDYNDIFRLGVAISDSPEGPFVPQPDPIRGSYSIDPCLFKDEDGKCYCYFGGIWGGQLQNYKNNKLLDFPILPKGGETAIQPRVAVMSDDLLQFAESPRPLVILDNNGNEMIAEDPHHFFEASWMVKDNGKYYFMYSTGDSHLMCLAEGNNPYGPFTFKKEILGPVIGWTTHGSLCLIDGKWYLFHHDSAPSGGKTWLRSIKVTETSL